MAKYFGTDGIRLHAEEFTFDFLTSVMDGLVAYHGGSDFSLLIGGDTRASTATILKDLSAIAEEKGIRCVNIGVFPTPAINFYLGHTGLDFAIDVTASHNPATYNGLKIFELKDNKSTKLCAKGCAAIENCLAGGEGSVAVVEPRLGGPLADVAESRLGDSLAAREGASGAVVEPGLDRSLAVSEISPRKDGREIEQPGEITATDTLSSYLNHLRDYLGTCNFHGQKIILDCANGATSVIAGRLFTEFGAEVKVISADQNYGTSINSDCGSTHLEHLIQAVQAEKANFGAAFDGDGDRCLLVDHTGQVVDGDKILALLAEHLELSSIVVTIMAGQGLFNWAKDHNINLEITDVGDQNVYAKMQEKDIRLGGEQSGHIILPFEPMGDGMLTALMVSKIVSERQTPLATLASAIPTLPQLTLNVPATKAQKQNLRTPAAEAVIEKYKGFINGEHGRLLVRPSGTEDLIRVTMWADETINIDALTRELAKELQEVL